MTKLRTFNILLTNPQPVYWPGQIVQGQLIVELDADMKMREIRIKCKGKGHTHWTTGSGDNKKTHSATEEYIDNCLVALGRAPGQDEVVLTSGSHSFPFQFVLPPALPGSFEAANRSRCFVRYYIKGTIDKPWKFDPECKQMFTVGSVLDLNQVPDVMTSPTAEDTKTVCCCCCETPPISARFKIDKSGYVPGESIVCTADIDEKTGRGVHSSKIKLMMKTTFMTHGSSRKTDTVEVCRLAHGEITPGGQDTFMMEKLQIPPVPPSHLVGCSIIDIQYIVQLTVNVKDTMLDLDLPLNITIGTIPLQSTVHQYMPNYQPGIVTAQPPAAGFAAPSVPGGPGPSDFNAPPPAYEECVFGKVNTAEDDDEHTSGNMSYAPAYTYYNWDKMAQTQY